MIQNASTVNSEYQPTNVINISSSQPPNRNQNSSQSNRSERRSRFNLPSEYKQQQSSNIASSENSRIKVSKNRRIDQSMDMKDTQQEDNQMLSHSICIKEEEAVNEEGSISQSVNGKTIQFVKREDHSSSNHQINEQQNTVKVMYGNQALQVKQNNPQIIDLMNSSMQSFHSKKSKDLQVYSAQDNKVLVLQVKNPENIEKLKLRIEQEEKRKKSIELENIVSNGNEEQKEAVKKKDQTLEPAKSDNVLSCKICLEEGNSEKQGKLFTPCQCTGTCKWIHEECLKEWIISRYVHLQSSNNPRDFLKAECEICKYKYNMRFDTQFKFYKDNIMTRNGKKNFCTCLCSLVCILAYVMCLLFFLVINQSSGGGSSSNNNSNNNPSNNGGNNGNGTNGNSSGGASNMGIQSYEYALIIVCTLLIMLSLVVCVISTKQAFFRKSIAKWTIFKYDPVAERMIIIQNQQKEKIDGNGHQSSQPQYIHVGNNQRQDRRYQNGQQQTNNNNYYQRTHNVQSYNRYNQRRQQQPQPQRTNSVRRDVSTQDQNSNVFNIRNSELAGMMGSQNLMLIQDERANQNNNNNNYQIINNQDISQSDNQSSLNYQQNYQDQNQANRNQVQINDNFEYFNNSQDMEVYQFNQRNERQQPFNFSDNY